MYPNRSSGIYREQNITLNKCNVLLAIYPRRSIRIYLWDISLFTLLSQQLFLLSLRMYPVDVSRPKNYPYSVPPQKSKRRTIEVLLHSWRLILASFLINTCLNFLGKISLYDMKLLKLSLIGNYSKSRKSTPNFAPRKKTSVVKSTVGVFLHSWRIIPASFLINPWLNFLRNFCFLWYEFD